MKEVMTFRLKESETLKKRLELADELGINVSEAMRDALPDVLERAIKQKAQQMRKVLAQVPA